MSKAKNLVILNYWLTTEIHVSVESNFKEQNYDGNKQPITKYL